MSAVTTAALLLMQPSFARCHMQPQGLACLCVADTHTHAHTPTCTHTNKHTQPQPHTLTHTHQTHTHTHSQHTDTARHTHTSLPPCPTNRLGKPAEAEPLYRTALAVRASALGPEDPDVAVTAHNLGVCLSSTGQHAEALVFHKQALFVREAAAASGKSGGGGGGAASRGSSGGGAGGAGASGGGAGDALSSHRAAAQCLKRLGCEAEAEPHLRALLAAARAAVDAAGPAGRRRRDALVELSVAAEDLGRCLTLQGAHERAEDAWWEAVEARREAMGDGHASVREIEERLRQCLEALQ